MPSEYELRIPFWTDTEAYSDRDREMFVCGVEFEMLRVELVGGEQVCRTIHVENESRARMLAHKLARQVTIEPSGSKGWSYLTSPGR